MYASFLIKKISLSAGVIFYSETLKKIVSEIEPVCQQREVFPIITCNLILQYKKMVESL